MIGRRSLCLIGLAAGALFAGSSRAVPIAWSSAFQGLSSVASVAILSSGTSWSVPTNWNNSTVGANPYANKVECIGGGEGGTNLAGTGVAQGGSGGGYATQSNITLAPGGSATYAIGAGTATHTAGGDSWFNAASCVAASVCAAGGASLTSPVGSVTYAGGGGATVTGGGGGGGAAGPHGAGGIATTQTGGAADAGFGGAGGAAGNPGGNGAEWSTAGSGGGGGGDSAASGGKPGGNYGGGGGGANNADGAGVGIHGVCVVTYYPLI